jgi:hypothetical protein
MTIYYQPVLNSKLSEKCFTLIFLKHRLQPIHMGVTISVLMLWSSGDNLIGPFNVLVTVRALSKVLSSIRFIG